MKLRTGGLCFLLVAFALPVYPQTSSSTDQSETIRLLMQRIDQLEKRVQELEDKPKEESKAASTNSPKSSEVADKSTGSTIQRDPTASVATVASNGPVKVSRPAHIADMHDMHDMHGENTISKTSTAGPTSPNGEANAASGGAAQNDQMESMAEAAQPTYPSLHISGFGAVNYEATNFPGSKTGFALPQFVLHFASALAPNVDFFSEWSFSGQGGVDTRVVEIERAIIRYSVNDKFKLSIGRYHTPINYWNTAFHHGTWLQTTVTRPEMIVFGGSFLPPHFVGLLAEGVFPADGLNLNYQVGVGNGRGFPISRAGTTGDINNNKAYLGGVFIKPDRFHSLQTGGAFYHDLISQPDGRSFQEFITTGHIVWTKEKPEVLAEFANVHHRQESLGFLDTGHISDSQAAYIQVAYRLPGFADVLKPFYRYEYIHIPRSDGAYATAGEPTLSGSFFGLRYDVTQFAALKVEYDRKTRRDEKNPEHILFLQTDFTF